MAVTKKTIVNVICDHCRHAINTTDGDVDFLSIGGHGLTFHLGCFTGMTSSELLRHMGHDESVIHTIQSDGTLKEEGLRLRDPRALRQDCTIDWSRAVEKVEWPL